MDTRFKNPEPVRKTLVERELLPSVHALGLATKNYRFIGRKGDLVAFLTQSKIEAGGKEVPVMILANARQPRERQIMFPLAQLWKVMEPRALAEVAIPLAKHLYGFVTRDDPVRVLDALLEFGEDLKNAPAPSWIPPAEYLAAIGRDGFVLSENGQAINE